MECPRHQVEHLDLLWYIFDAKILLGEKDSDLNIDVKQVLNILDSYGSLNAAKGNIGLHRLIEAFKHMFAARMNLGDPDFVDISKTVSEMLSPNTAKEIRERILDNATFPADYYMYR